MSPPSPNQHPGEPAAEDESTLPTLDPPSAETRPLDAEPAIRRYGDPPPLVGPWRLMSLLGRGGMGDVYLAERADGAFEKRVALKLIRTDRAAMAAWIERERRVLARLEHPNIARLLDGGVTGEGIPYLVTEYVDGRDLETYIAESKLDLRARIVLFFQICAAVAYAHANLTVHRDLKPANILVDAQGRARLLDFGIAKLLDRESGEDGSPHTPEFAAPEQVLGEPVTTRTDVYALGLILYCMLTGRRAQGRYAAPGLDPRARVVEHRPPPPSRSVRPELRALVPPRRLRGDLDAIVAKATHKDPAQRYASVDALADDLRAFLDARPVAARGSGAWYVARRWIARHRFGLALAATVAAVLLGSATYTLTQRARALEREREAADERRRAQAIAEFMWALFQDLNLQGAGGTKVLEQAETYAERFLSTQPALLMSMYATIASTYGQLGEQSQRAAIYQRAYARAEALGQVEFMAQAGCALGLIEAEGGREEPARRRFAAAAAALDRLAGGAWEARMDCRLAEAKALRQLGHAAEALPLLADLREAVAARQGRSDPEYGNVLSAYASAAIDAREYALAESLLAELEALLVDQKATESDRMATLLHNRGTVLRHLGRWREAEALLERALDLARLRGLNQANPGSLCALAGVRIARGALAAAEEPLALAFRQLDADPSFPLTQRFGCWRERALLALWAGRWQEFDADLAHADRLAAAAWGADDVRVQGLRVWALRAKARRDLWPEVEAGATRMLADLHGTDAARHSIRAHLLRLLARAAQVRGDAATALESARAAEAAGRAAKLGEEHPDQAEAWWLAAQALSALGAEVEAARLKARVRLVYARELVPEHPWQAEVR